MRLRHRAATGKDIDGFEGFEDSRRKDLYARVRDEMYLHSDSQLDSDHTYEDRGSAFSISPVTFDHALLNGHQSDPHETARRANLRSFILSDNPGCRTNGSDNALSTEDLSAAINQGMLTTALHAIDPDNVHEEIDTCNSSVETDDSLRVTPLIGEDLIPEEDFERHLKENGYTFCRLDPDLEYGQVVMEPLPNSIDGVPTTPKARAETLKRKRDEDDDSLSTDSARNTLVHLGRRHVAVWTSFSLEGWKVVDQYYCAYAIGEELYFCYQYFSREMTPVFLSELHSCTYKMKPHLMRNFVGTQMELAYHFRAGRAVQCRVYGTTLFGSDTEHGTAAVVGPHLPNTSERDLYSITKATIDTVTAKRALLRYEIDRCGRSHYVQLEPAALDRLAEAVRQAADGSEYQGLFGDMVSGTAGGFSSVYRLLATGTTGDDTQDAILDEVGGKALREEGLTPGSAWNYFTSNFRAFRTSPLMKHFCNLISCAVALGLLQEHHTELVLNGIKLASFQSSDKIESAADIMLALAEGVDHIVTAVLKSIEQKSLAPLIYANDNIARLDLRYNQAKEMMKKIEVGTFF